MNMNRDLYIFDLDGTIANLNHRLHFIKDEKKSWSDFFSSCPQDEPIQWVINLLDNLKAGNPRGEFVILSSRNADVMETTERWLFKHKVYHDVLIMRPSKDFRPDEIVKLELLMGYLASEGLKKDNVKFIIDDRQKVVNMWRKNGFNVLQCNAWEE